MPVPYSAASDALEEYRRIREEREMREALAADGAKLALLTGQDHGPEFLETCGACDGYGTIAKRVTVYEHGCGFPHDDTHEQQCDHCNGLGFFIVEA